MSLGRCCVGRKIGIDFFCAVLMLICPLRLNQHIGAIDAALALLDRHFYKAHSRITFIVYVLVLIRTIPADRGLISGVRFCCCVVSCIMDILILIAANTVNVLKGGGGVVISELSC